MIDIFQSQKAKNFVMSNEALMKQAEKEQAALTMCGGLLGTNYLMQEFVDSIIVDAVGSFDKKWYRQTIKQNIKAAMKLLHDHLSLSRSGSASNKEAMMDAADALYDKCRIDYQLMYNGVLLALGRLHCDHAKDAAHLICIDCILALIADRYESVLEHMNGIYPAFYDSWYNHAHCDDVRKRWGLAMDEMSSKYIRQRIDVNSIQYLMTGLKALQNHIAAFSHSDEIAAIKDDYSDYSDKEYQEALRTLGVA